jgi:hypothetical protein
MIRGMKKDELSDSLLKKNYSILKIWLKPDISNTFFTRG